jgi:hypothetical protein
LAIYWLDVLVVVDVIFTVMLDVLNLLFLRAIKGWSPKSCASSVNPAAARATYLVTVVVPTVYVTVSVPPVVEVVK